MLCIIDKPEKFEKYQWRLVANNNKTVCVSEMLYPDYSQAKEAAERFIKTLQKENIAIQ